MTALKPEILVVVEVAIRETPELWVKLPPRPWPSHVRLYRKTPPDQVALVVGVASTYGDPDGEAAKSARAAAERFPQVLPGGLAVAESDRRIMPGCCCGLESWPEWRKLLTGQGGPWTGHDPSPLIEVTEQGVEVWSDGGMGNKPAGESPIIFKREEFTQALNEVQQDLADFLVPLREWLDTHAPLESADIVSRFRATFVDL